LHEQRRQTGLPERRELLDELGLHLYERYKLLDELGAELLERARLAYELGLRLCELSELLCELGTELLERGHVTCELGLHLCELPELLCELGTQLGGQDVVRLVFVFGTVIRRYDNHAGQGTCVSRHWPQASDIRHVAVTVGNIRVDPASLFRRSRDSDQQSPS
jgi:hypothetical protein